MPGAAPTPKRVALDAQRRAPIRQMLQVAAAKHNGGVEHPWVAMQSFVIVAGAELVQVDVEHGIPRCQPPAAQIGRVAWVDFDIRHSAGRDGIDQAPEAVEQGTWQLQTPRPR